MTTAERAVLDLIHALLTFAEGNPSWRTKEFIQELERIRERLTG